jgi:NADPH:quinone reductase
MLPREGRPTMSTLTNLAVVVDPDAPGRLVIRPVPEPVPDRGEAIIRVRAISLNRGEVRRSGMAAAGWRPGWDLAGVVERAAADGSGPSVGERVVGFLPEGAWAQRVAVPKNALAVLPDKVTFSQAATFPVAGLTALLALGKGGVLVGRRVLVTGATGGVGDFAVQLARLAGAHVTASVRRADQTPTVRELGAHEVVVGEEIPREPKYDLIIDSVGGRTLGTALAALQRSGVCVTLGVSASAEVTFDAREFFVTGRSTLYGLYLFTEFGSEPASVGLRRLAELVAAGQLAPHISLERPWKEITQVAQDLMARRFHGKAVLVLD